MELYTITEEGLAAAMTALMADYKVVAPVEKGPSHVFDEITDWSLARPLAVGTTLPPKKTVFPQREVLLKFRAEGGGFEAEEVIDDTPTVMAGVHPCDIAGLRCIDHTFGGRYYDRNYGARRRSTIVLGFDCMPDDYCFCASVGALSAEKGYDLFLTSTRPGGYVMRIGTKRGEELLARYFTAASSGGVYEESAIEDFELRKRDAMKAAIDVPVEHLPAIYQASMDSQVWRKWGDLCLSCGSCNLVCPTCYCFDVQDRVSLNGAEGTRSRVWDGCMLFDFATVAGGHNFRPTPWQRLLHRHNRKFNYQYDRYGEPHCTGCGRCGRACLVRINMVTIANELAAERRGEVA